MNFDYNEEQRLLAESVRRLVAQEYSFEARRRVVASAEGASEATWKSFAHLGILGLPIAAEHGGFAGGAIDMISTMEAFGEALVVEPYLATVGFGARLVTLLGSDAQKREVLGAIVEGRLKLAVAHTEAQSRYDLSRAEVQAVEQAGAHVLRGEKRAVLHAPNADKLLVTAAERGRIQVFMVEKSAPGVEMARYRTLDALAAADVRFRDTPAQRLGEDTDALRAVEAAVDFATALVCAEAVGAIRYANETTLEYLKTRRQFGVPIGSFQALQHRMVDMLISYEQARSMASLACARVDAERDPRQRARAVSAAKVRVAQACVHVSQESVQLHGGMGMTDELKVSHTFRRLTMIAQQFGDVDHHLERFSS